ncbi:hypothetical protein E2986_12626 [Frieseomelitta varia]|uniref:Elongation of very long chain fatty acids protein n=1 Tax=Frieseomelitta varia TaxID=561572 RepID=A0A833WBA9_9HYME|nr:elongation of very long chain fatty acids protein 6-like [Frieseomelitta varia]XP_043511769.1 elongation of very long chain fatty acids protein 6-like [Frieseomelitta varia]KAF3426718.1 hypothetical protein E2986_12626 [Frieseomelitta varia]
MNKVHDIQITVPNYSHVFNIEKTYFYPDNQAWITNNFSYCFYCCGIYLILIFGGKYYMSSRPKFNLRGPLALWSGLLATFSIIGFSRTAPELFHVLQHHGFYHSVCTPSNLLEDCVSGFWSWMFILSKIPELIDTFFIVLRKQPLIFLHWYHHLSAFLFVWYIYAETVATTRWYFTMNYFVHSVMYSYYSLKAMQYKLPKSVAVMITMLQIVQMIMGGTVTTAAYYYRKSGHFECYMSQENFIVCFFVYFSYLVIFVKLFYKNYLSGKSATEDEKIRFAEIATYANKKAN